MSRDPNNSPQAGPRAQGREAWKEGASWKRRLRTRRPGLLGWGWGWGLGRWPGGWACGSQAGTSARAQRLPPLGSTQSPRPWPPQEASLPRQTLGPLLLGRWGSGPGTEGSSPEVSRPSQLSAPSQQGGKMGHPPEPHSAPALAGTTAVPGLIPDLIPRIPCELWDPGRGVGTAGPMGAAAVHGGISPPFLRPPPGPCWAIVTIAVAAGVLTVS